MTARAAAAAAARPVSAGPQGFTLLEVLVALAVVAVALAAGVRALGQAADVAGALAERNLARWVAEDQAALLRAQGQLPAVGTVEGKVTSSGRAFAWTEVAEDLPQSPFRRVEVTVRADRSDATVLARVALFLLRGPGG